jgi:ParB-like chromosome segregation protein Spo0J
MEWLLEVAKEYGVTVALVAYVLWDSRGREQRYISIIDKLSDSFQEMKKDLEQIKNRLLR